MLSHIPLSRVSPFLDETLVIISVGFYITDELPIRSSAFLKYWREKENVSIMRNYITYSY
jgi:hypothetical protein